MDSRNFMVGLPIEILLRIAKYLHTADLGAMRLTCKHFERALFNSFAHEFFCKKQFMLSDESLQALVDISHHKDLSPFLKYVIIGLDRFDLQESSFDDPDADILYHKATGNQLHLIRTGRAVYMLAEAFRNLSNLKSVDIRDFEGKRTRDGPNARWRSYGATDIGRQLGRSIQISGTSGDDHPTVVLTIILAALADAGARPESLEVLLRTRYWGLRDFAFTLPPWSGNSIASVVAGLRKLHLDVSLAAENTRLPWATNQATSPTLGLCLHRFLSEAHKLDWLRLNFQGEPNESVCNSFIERLGQGSATPNSTPLPSLKQLDLGLGSFSLSKLVDLSARFPLLTTVRLLKVDLVDQTAEDRHPNLWAELLKHFAKANNLRSLSVGFASQKKEGGHRLHISFAGENKFEYTGDALGQFLKKLVHKTKFDDLDAEDVESEASDSEDGSEDEEVGAT